MNKRLLKLLENLIEEAYKNESELETLESELYELDEEVHEELWPYMEEDLFIYRNVKNDIEKIIDWIKNPTINYPISYYRKKIEKLRNKHLVEND